MQMRGVLFALALGSCGLQAADQSSIRSTPLEVYTLPYSDGQTRIVANWGSQGETLNRRPQDVQREVDELKEWMYSATVQEALAKEQKALEPIEAEQGRAEAQELLAKRSQVAQDPNVPRSTTVVERTVDIPSWLAGIPWDVRQALTVAAFDARDPKQVEWAIQTRHTNPEANIFAVGWRSQDDLVAIQNKHPSLKVLYVVSVPGHRQVSDWLSDYEIRSIPALIRFPDVKSLAITEGMP